MERVRQDTRLTFSVDVEIVVALLDAFKVSLAYIDFLRSTVLSSCFDFGLSSAVITLLLQNTGNKLFGKNLVLRFLLLQIGLRRHCSINLNFRKYSSILSTGQFTECSGLFYVGQKLPIFG